MKSPKVQAAASSLNKKKRDRLCSQGGAIKPKGVFHLSELTGQTLSAVMRISLLIKLPTQISQILNGIQEGDNVSAKKLEKADFPAKMTGAAIWSSQPVLTNGKSP